MGLAIESMPIAPESVIVFGSFARREAAAQSDIDVVVIRPDDTEEENETWSAALDAWRRDAASITGNSVEIVEVPLSEAAAKLRGRSEFWKAVRRDGLCVHGLSIEQIVESVHV